MMGDISDNFSRSEFACSDGCGFNVVDTDLLMLCELVRNLNGSNPLTPNSACRCKPHNNFVGGGQKSQHLLGKAADLPVDNPKEIYDKLCERFPSQYGFGLYESFIHVDSRGTKARWLG